MEKQSTVKRPHQNQDQNGSQKRFKEGPISRYFASSSSSSADKNNTNRIITLIRKDDEVPQPQSKSKSQSQQQSEESRIKEIKPKYETRVPRIQLTSTSWVDVIQIPKELRLTKEEFEILWNLKPAELGKIRLFGKMIQVPRWQQTFGRDYFYSGLLHKSQPMHPILSRYMDWCKAFSPTLNGCLVNWYQDHTHNIGFHSDAESELLPNSEIYSLSFGARREFVFQEKKNTSNKYVVPLTDGTLVVMGGTCQKTHKHAVPVSTGICGRRINITFRSFKKNVNSNEK